MTLRRHDVECIARDYIRMVASGDASPGISSTNGRYFHEVNYRLRLWGHVFTPLLRLASDDPVPLYRNPEPTALLTQQWLVAESVLKRLTQALKAETQDQTAAELGCFEDFSQTPGIFLADAHAALRVALALGRKPPMRFLDVGCGGGMAVLLATAIFAVAEGLDYDMGYVMAGQRLLGMTGHNESRIFHANGLLFDRYAEYDVIYFFQPMRDPEGLVALEKRIVDGAQSGTVLIAPYTGFANRAEGLGCGHVAGSVFVKGTALQDADALADAAQYFGTRLALTPADDDPRAGYLLPIQRASRARGL